MEDLRNPRTVDRCADLILDPSWARRRKDKISIDGLRYLRFRSTLDFEVPEGTELGSGGTVAIPFTFLKKDPGGTYEYDLVDRNGKGLSMPRSALNREMTSLVIAKLLMRAGGPINKRLPKILDSVASQPDAAKGRKLLERSGWKKLLPPNLRGDSTFEWLVETSAWASLVVVEIEAGAGDAAMIKMDSIEQFDRLRDISRCVMLREIPYVSAQTYHLAVHLPESFQIKKTSLRVICPGLGSTAKDRRYSANEEYGRTHTYLEDATKCRTAYAYTRFGPLPGLNLLSLSPVLAIGMLIALTMAALASLDPREGGIQTITMPILLLFPAIVATQLTAVSEPLVRDVVRRAKNALLVAVSGVFFGAITLITQAMIRPAWKGYASDLMFVWTAAVGLATVCILIEWVKARR